MKTSILLGTPEITSVYVVGENAMVIRMFQEHPGKFTITNTPKKANVIVFPGGADINPGFYGQKAIQGITPTRWCDERDYNVWSNNKDDAQKFFVGICRGAQFLNVMNGGKLWQHVNNHRLGNGTHEMIDTLTDDVIRVNSTHYQMMRPTKDAEVLGIAYEATVFMDDTQDLKADGQSEKQRQNNPNVPEYDPEILWYRQTKSLCYQPHPEYGGYTKKHFFELFDKLYR